MAVTIHPTFGCCTRKTLPGSSPYYYDSTLDLTLSMTEASRPFYNGSPNIEGTRWMNLMENIPSNIIGLIMGEEDHLITSIYSSCKGISAGGFIKFDIFNEGNFIHDFTLVPGEKYKVFQDVNLVVTALKEFSVRITTVGSSKISYPTVFIHTRKIFN